MGNGIISDKFSHEERSEIILDVIIIDMQMCGM